MATRDLTTPGTAPAVPDKSRPKAMGGAEWPAKAASAPDLGHGYNATPEADKQPTLADIPPPSIEALGPLPDADLLAACAEFRRLDDWLVAHSKGVEAEFNANHAARWETTYSLERIAPQTLAGLRAKAEVAVMLSDEAYGQRPTDGSCEFMVEALRDVVAFTQPEDEPEQDAELIAACAEFDALERRLQHACNVEFADDDAASDAVAETLAPARYAALGRICATPPTSIAGLRAVASTLLLEDTPLAGRVNQDDDEDDFLSSRLLHTLLRGLSTGDCCPQDDSLSHV